VAGTWKLERGRRAATLSVQPFATLAVGEHDELFAEAERLMRFLAPAAEEHAVRLGHAA
jgi:hypothetical protein